MASEEETQQDDGDSGKRDISEKLSNAPGTDEKTTKKIEESLAKDEERTDDGQAELTGEF